MIDFNRASDLRASFPLRLVSALALAVPTFVALATDVVAAPSRRASPELIQTCTRAARVGVPDSMASGADRSREMIYRACIANGGPGAAGQARIDAAMAYAAEPVRSYPQFTSISDPDSSLGERPLGVNPNECMTDEGYGRWSACR